MAISANDMLAQMQAGSEPAQPGERRIIDGDTFVEPDGTRVRLQGIDAPEVPKVIDGQLQPGTPGGLEAAEMLRRILEQNPDASVELTGDQSYDREVGRVVGADGADVVSEGMIGVGAARPTRFSDQRQLNAEGTALARDLGLFAAVDDPEQRQMFAEMRQAIERDVGGREPNLFGGPAMTDGGGTLSSSFKRGIDEMQATLYAGANAFGEATGFDAVAEWGEEGLLRNMYEAAINPAEVGSYENIEDLSSFGTWVLEVLGEQIPNIAMLLTGFGSGATVARAAVGKALLKKAESSVLKKYGGRQFMGSATGEGIRNLARREVRDVLPGALKKAGRRGGAAGGFAASYPLGVGEVQRELKASGIDAPGTALLAGVPIAALDALSFDVMLGQFFKDLPVKASSNLVSTIAKGFGVGMGKANLAEIPAEVAQEMVVLAARAYEDPSFEIFTEDNAKRLIEAGLSAAVVSTTLGGTGGTVSAVRTRAKERRAADMLKRIKGADPAADNFTNTDSPTAEGGDPDGGSAVTETAPQSGARPKTEGPPKPAKPRRKVETQSQTLTGGTNTRDYGPGTQDLGELSDVTLEEALENDLRPSTENPDENVVEYEVTDSRTASIMERLFPGTKRRKEGGRHVLTEDMGPKPLRSDERADNRDVRAALAKVFDDGRRDAKRRIELVNTNPKLAHKGKTGNRVRANLQQIVYLGATLNGKKIGSNPSVADVREGFASGMAYLADLGLMPKRDLEPKGPLKTGESRQAFIDRMFKEGRYDEVFDLPLDTQIMKSGVTLGDLVNVSGKVNEAAENLDVAEAEATLLREEGRNIEDRLDELEGDLERLDRDSRRILGMQASPAPAAKDKEGAYRGLDRLREELDVLIGRREAAGKGDGAMSAEETAFLEANKPLARRLRSRIANATRAFDRYREALRRGDAAAKDLQSERKQLKNDILKARTDANLARDELRRVLKEIESAKAKLEAAGISTPDGRDRYEHEQRIDDDEEVVSEDEAREAREESARRDTEQLNKTRPKGDKDVIPDTLADKLDSDIMTMREVHRQVKGWLEAGSLPIASEIFRVLKQIGVTPSFASRNNLKVRTPEYLRELLEALAARGAVKAKDRKSVMSETERDTRMKKAMFEFEEREQVKNLGHEKFGPMARFMQEVLDYIGVKTRVILVSESTLPTFINTMRERAEHRAGMAEEAKKRRLARNPKSKEPGKAEREHLEAAAHAETLARELESILADKPAGRIIFNDNNAELTARVPIIFVSEKAKNRTATKQVQVIAHEMGHLVERSTFEQASPEVRKALFEALVPADLATNTEAHRQQVFSENFANQLLRWMVAREAPSNIVDKFFKGLVARLRKLWNGLRGKGAVDGTFAEYMDALVNARARRRGEIVAEPRTALGRRIQADVDNFVASPFLPEYQGIPTADFTAGINKGIDSAVSRAVGKVRDAANVQLSKPNMRYVRKVAENFSNIMKGIFEVVFQSNDSYLRSIGLDWLADNLRTRPDSTGERRVEPVGAQTRRLMGRWEVRIERLSKRIRAASKEEVKAAQDELQAQVPTKELKTEFAREARAYYADLLKFLNERFDLGIEARANYSPMVVDLREWNTHESEVKQILRDSGLYETEEAVDNVFKEISQSDGALMPDTDEVIAPGFKFRNQRKWDKEMYDKLRPYMVDDITGLMAFYTHAAIRRGVWQTRFGGKVTRETEDGGAKEYTDPSKKINDYLFARMQAGKLTDAQYRRVVDKILPAYTGTLGADIDPRIRQFNSVMVVYQNLRLLSMAVFSSFVDIGQIDVRSGRMLESSRQIAKLLRASARDRKEAYEMAKYLGAIREDVTEHVLNDQLTSQFMSPNARKINEGFFRLIGMHAWTKLTRVMAMRAGIDFLERHSEGLSEKSRQNLRELGVTREEVREWLAYKERHGNVAAMKAQGFDNVQAAINQFIDESIIRPDAAQRPAWASDPRYMLVWHLKSFMWGLHETVLRRVFSQAGSKEGFARAVPFIMLATALLPFAAAGYELRQQVKWLGNPPRGTEKEGAEYFWEVVQRSGMLGVMQLYVDTNEAENFGRFAPLALLGPAAGQAEEFLTKDFGYFAVRATPLLAQAPGLAKLFEGDD